MSPGQLDEDYDQTYLVRHRIVFLDHPDWTQGREYHDEWLVAVRKCVLVTTWQGFFADFDPESLRPLILHRRRLQVPALPPKGLLRPLRVPASSPRIQYKRMTSSQHRKRDCPSSLPPCPPAPYLVVSPCLPHNVFDVYQ